MFNHQEMEKEANTCPLKNKQKAQQAIYLRVHCRKKQGMKNVRHCYNGKVENDLHLDSFCQTMILSNARKTHIRNKGKSYAANKKIVP